MIPFPEVVDNSMLEAAKACDHKVFLEYFLHWKGLGTNPDLHAGKSFAQGLEAARLAFYAQGKTPEESEAIGMGALMQAYGTYQCPPENPKSFERMCGALEYYFDEFPLTSDACTPIVLEASGKRAIEFNAIEPLPIDHPQTGHPLLYSVRLDMLANFADGLYVEDDKTAKQLGESWVKKWDLSPQVSGYIWAVDKALGIRPKGALIRGVSILKTQYGKAQAITYRAPWQIQEWLDTTCELLEEMISKWKKGRWRKVLGDPCSSYGGCQFRSICLSENPEPWLNQYFERRKWDPVTRTETKL